MKKNPRNLLIVVLLLALVAAACGSDDDSTATIVEESEAADTTTAAPDIESSSPVTAGSELRVTEVDFLDPVEQQRVKDIRDTYEEAFRSTISAGVDSGVFRKECDPTLATIYILSILNALDRWYDETGSFDRDAIIDDIYGFAHSGLT